MSETFGHVCGLKLPTLEAFKRHAENCRVTRRAPVRTSAREARAEPEDVSGDQDSTRGHTERG